MKCEDFIDGLECLSEDSFLAEMRSHMAECDDCRGYYEELASLKPVVVPATPHDIGQNVLIQIKKSETLKTKLTMKRISKTVASLAGAAMIGVMIFFAARPVEARAAAIVDQSIQSIADVRSMVMKVNVRMGGNYGFGASTDPGHEMVEVTIAMKRNPDMWRIDKKQDDDRKLVFDGEKKYLWFPKTKEGVIGLAEYGFEGDLEILLNPEMLLMRERLSICESYAKYSVKKTRNEIIMTATVDPQGDYSESAYMLNKTISTSLSRRVITFDKKTKTLKGLQIYVRSDAGELLVIDVREIKYNVPVDVKKMTELPCGYKWMDYTKPETIKVGSKFIGITADEAAKRIFKGIANHDFESVKDAFVLYDYIENECLQKLFDPGVKVLEVGKPFKSGLYPGVFIPYKLRFGDGTVKENHPLPIRNDDESFGFGWYVDGGI